MFQPAQTHVLTRRINKAIHVLLMHGFGTLRSLHFMTVNTLITLVYGLAEY